MAKENVLVGCKLPHGLILELPTKPEIKVELNGLNKSQVIGATYATTEVDAAVWEEWLKNHKDSSFIKSGAIFVASNAGDIKAKGRELEKEKTGLEPMPQSAMGVKPAEKE